MNDQPQSARAVVSMTGFGTGEARAAQQCQARVSIRSVNSRFLDLVFKGHRLSAAVEADLRNFVAATVHRGKVEVNVSLVRSLGAVEVPLLDHDQAGTLLQDILAFMGSRMPVTPEMRAQAALAVMARREVWSGGFEDTSEDLEPTEIAVIEDAFRAALAALTVTRTNEGTRLLADITSRIDRIAEIRNEMVVVTAGEAERVNAELRARLDRIAADSVTDERLLQEVAILAEKSDVSEELVRIESHLTHMQEVLAKPPQGKVFEFYLQELLREVNTVGSKARRSSVSELVVTAKAEIERLREQVANVE